MGEYFLFTLAAQVMTLPVTLYHFGKVSLSALLANPLILPAQPPVMVLGGMAVLSGMVWEPLGRILAALAWPFLAYTVRLVELLAPLFGGALNLGQASIVSVALFYALLIGWPWAGSRLRSAAGLMRGGLALALLAALTMWVWRAALAAPDGRLHLTVLDVGSGDALLIQTPGGRNLLIDGAPSTTALSEALGRRLPPGNRRLDWLVVAAPGDEQIGALPAALERFPPGDVLWAGPPSGTRAARLLQEQFAQSSSAVPYSEAEAGQALYLGSGAALKVLAAGARGAVLLLEWGSFQALLPVGLDFETLEALQKDVPLREPDVLLLADCGSAPLNDPEWLEALRPRLALLSVSAGDRDGRPAPETLAALEGYPLLRTDRNGWIKIATDGERMWVEVERE